MTDKQSTQRDLLIELKTQTTEVLRRMDGIDRQLVPRKEYEEKVRVFSEAHVTNQHEIERMQSQINTLMWKLGGGLATLQVLTSIVLFILARG